MGDNAVHGRGKRFFAPTTPTAPDHPNGARPHFGRHRKRLVLLCVVSKSALPNGCGQYKNFYTVWQLQLL